MWISAKSKDLSYLDIVKEHVAHKKRMGFISSRVDNSPPKQRSHVVKDLKKRILNDGRLDEINNNNRILLEKLIKVVSRQSSTPRIAKEPVWKPKKIEDLAVSMENSRIMQKIKDSKSYYSSEKFRQEYKYSFKLKKMLQQHSFKIHRFKTFDRYLNLDRTKANASPREL